MKKLVLIFAAFVLAITLAACNRDPSDLDVCLSDPTAPECQTACPTGQELVGTSCLDVCPEGEHREGESCVVDTVSCPDGEHEEAGVCVIDDTRTPEEIAIDFIVDNYDGDMTFLSTAMVNMHFEQAMTMTTEFNFEVTEDINEVHYIEAIITDHFVYDETNGDMIKRDMNLDIDGEVVLQFSVILHEVPTGVHVYIEVAPIITELATENPEAADILGWVGFEHQWAVVKLDDSLQNVVELEVLKDMVVSLFFSEMGETFFYDVQENMIEPTIGFDLSQYDVNLGVLVDYIIEENWTEVELALNAVQYENIVLHADAMYIAPEIRKLLLDYELDLEAAGFDFDNLVPMLDVATWNAVDEVWDVTLPVDPLEGTEAFFRAMTPTDIEALTDVVIKPLVSNAIYHNMMQTADPDWLYDDYLAVLQQNEQFLIDNWPVESGTYVPADEYVLYASLGPLAYYLQLTEPERGVIQWAVDMNNHGWVVNEFDQSSDNREREEYRWFMRRYEEEVDIHMLENDLHTFLVNNQTYLETTYSFDVTQMLADLEDMGVHEFYVQLDHTKRQQIVDTSQEAGNEWAVDLINQLEHLAEYNWDYQWYYRNDYEFVHPMWLQDSLLNLINQHTTYMTDEYSVDVAQMIADIEMYGVVEWYMDYATPEQREILNEISYFNGDENDERWVVDTLERMMYEGGYHEWFGRAEEKHEIDWLTEQTIWFLEEFEQDIQSNSYDPYLWMSDIEGIGVIEWWGTLTQLQMDYLKQLADNNNWHEAHWTIYTLEHINMNLEEFDWCWGTWKYCHNPEDLTTEMVMLVEMYPTYLNDEYGINYLDLVAAIQAEGAMYYYFDVASEEDREVLRDLAKMNQWPYDVIWEPERILEFENDVLGHLMTHETYLNGLGVDATGMISDLQLNGIQDFMSNTMTVADIEIVFADYVAPKVEGLHAAILSEEVLEFLVYEFFSDMHITDILANEIGPNPVFDETIIAANMMAIDFDQLQVELEGLVLADLENLAQAIYDGQTAYDAHVAAMTQVNLALFLEVLSPGVLSAEPYLGYLHDVEYAYDNLAMFDQFIDPAYYFPGIGDAVPYRTADAELLMEVEFDGIAYAEIFDDLTEQVGLLASGFNSIPFPYDQDWVCLTEYLPECEEPDFVSVTQHLLTLNPITGHILYDPNDLTWMELGIDLTDFADGIVSEEYAERLQDQNYVPHEDNGDWTGVNELSVVVTMENASSITLPAEPDTTDVQAVASEFGKFAITSEAYQILENYMKYLPVDPLDLDPGMLNDPIFLATLEEMRFSAAFDLEMSYIEIVVPMVPNPIPGEPDIPDFTNMDYEIVLYWIDGTLVHSGPVGYEDMLGYWLDGDLVSEAAYDTIVGMVDDTNWHVMKLFTYYMWQDFDPEINME